MRGGGGVNFQLFCSEWSSVNEHLPAHANLQQFLPLCSLLCHQEQTRRTSVLGQGSGQGAGGKGAQTLQDKSGGWDGGGADPQWGVPCRPRFSLGITGVAPSLWGVIWGQQGQTVLSLHCVCVCVSCWLSSGKT